MNSRKYWKISSIIYEELCQLDQSLSIETQKQYFFFQSLIDRQSQFKSYMYFIKYSFPIKQKVFYKLFSHNFRWIHIRKVSRWWQCCLVSLQPPFQRSVFSLAAPWFWGRPIWWRTQCGNVRFFPYLQIYSQEMPVCQFFRNSYIL